MICRVALLGDRSTLSPEANTKFTSDMKKRSFGRNAKRSMMVEVAIFKVPTLMAKTRASDSTSVSASSAMAKWATVNSEVGSFIIASRRTDRVRKTQNSRSNTFCFDTLRALEV